MEIILIKKPNGSIDVMDKYGFTEYTVEKNESGVIARLANRLYEYENFFTEKLKYVLMDYFDINKCTYTYNLIRNKEAFDVGTMTFEDFKEFSEENIDDIVDYIKLYI